MLGFARGSAAPDNGQSRGTSRQTRGWGEKEPLTPQMNSPQPPPGCGDEDPSAKSPPPRRLGGDGSSHSHPTGPVEGGGFSPSAAAPTAAEPGPGFAPRRREAGRKPEAAAVSRKPCTVASQFSGSAGTAARAPAPPGCSRPPASYAGHWDVVRSALHLGKGQAWECGRSPGAEPGTLHCPKSHSMKPHPGPYVFKLTGTTPRRGAFSSL